MQAFLSLAHPFFNSNCVNSIAFINTHKCCYLYSKGLTSRAVITMTCTFLYTIRPLQDFVNHRLFIYIGEKVYMQNNRYVDLDICIDVIIVVRLCMSCLSLGLFCLSPLVHTHTHTHIFAFFCEFIIHIQWFLYFSVDKTVTHCIL